MTVEVQDAPVALETTAMGRTEIDVAIATAKRFPRSLSKFMKQVETMATVTEGVAEDCFYSLPREDKKTGETKWITGPSVRLAEMVVAAWGNCRVVGRIVEESHDYVVAQGVFHDLESNTTVSMEVRRSIVTKYGKRYSAEMVNVTANAAVAIATRNCVTKGVPRSFWDHAFQKAIKVVAGDAETLGTRRLAMVAHFQKIGVTLDALLARMEIKGVEDITLDTMVTLRGLFASIRDGDTTVEEAFPTPAKETAKAESTTTGVAGLKEAVLGKPVDQVSTPASVSMVADTATPAIERVAAAATAATATVPPPEPSQDAGGQQAAPEEPAAQVSTAPPVEPARPMCLVFPCTNETEPGSRYCLDHKDQEARTVKFGEPNAPRSTAGRKGKGQG